MLSKLQILCLVVFCGWFEVGKAQNVDQDSVSARLVIGNCFFVRINDDYMILSAFIVNNSNDTLRYWDPSGRLNEFFTVTGSENLKLVSENINPTYRNIFLAPHSSQHIDLKFEANPFRDGVAEFKVSMKFYHWFGRSSFNSDMKYHTVKILTDSIRVVRDGNNGTYLTQDNWIEKNKLKLQITSSLGANSLDKRTDTVTVDEMAITKTFVYTYLWRSFKLRSRSRVNDSKKETCFIVPVTIHNYGESTLYYDSMSCMWENNYGLSNVRLSILLRSCMEKNIQVTIEVPPHTTRTQAVVIVSADDILKYSEVTKIGLKVNNVIWSNEVHLKTD